jgi:hypothetical protein
MKARAPLFLCGSALLLAACGSTTSAAGGTAPSASAQPGGGRGGTFGQIVQVQGNALTVSTTAGDVNVAYTGSTTITSTSTGTPGDIVTGTCVVIAGLKNSAGTVTASTVRLSHPVNGSCTTNAFPGGGGRPGGSFSPRPASPGATPRPTPNPNAVFVTGMVTEVSGTTVTVTPATGAAMSISVPTTLTVTESSTGTAADLAVNSCVRAVGQKNAQGVVQATALMLQPTNATGTCTAAGGGGFGGGRFPGGGGGGFFGGGTPPTAA